jgi:uncharacterized membrane protein YccF (DUF307 family)
VELATAGVPIGAAHLKLTPMALARLGQLILARCATAQRQLPSRHYID